MENKTRIVIAIATYNRPKGLEAVLDGIVEQDVPDHLALRVVIADNSEDGNARSYVEERASTYRWPLIYFHEPERGISYPRNRGLDNALEQGDDFIAFTDDDVILDKNWMRELADVAQETGADAVIGAVEAKFHHPPPQWIADGGYVEVVAFPDRKPISYGHTTNVLVKMDCIRKLNLRFDPFFALTGGEDTAFFKAIREHGGLTVFARKAVVYECIGPERMKLSWWLKRWYRTGNTEGLLETRESSGKERAQMKVLSRGIYRSLLGAAGSLAFLPTRLVGRTDTFDFLRIMCRGAGFVTAVFGMTYEEYRDHDR